MATLTTDGSELNDSDREKLRLIVRNFDKMLRIGVPGLESYHFLLNQVEVRSGVIRITCWHKARSGYQFGQLVDWALPQRFNISLNA